MLWKRILHYRLLLARRQWTGRQASREPQPALARTPSVTLFITNLNNRYPLELTLKSALAHTDYPNLKIWIGENASTDSSREFLRSLPAGVNLKVLERDTPQPQHAWYDEMLRCADTEYWIGCHEDLLFTGRDWVRDLIAFLESSPQTDLLGGEYFPPQRDIGEPFGGRIDLEESLSTWLFAVRTSLREKIDTSFEFHKAGVDPATGREVCYDQGGWLIHEMRARGLGFAVMPTAYKRKWYHIENLTWGRKVGTDPTFRALKDWQARELISRARRYRAPWS